MDRGEVALVIGAGDATGGAIARRFARGGYRAVVTRRARHLDRAEKLAERIRAEGGAADAFGVDARAAWPTPKPDARSLWPRHRRVDLKPAVSRIITHLCVERYDSASLRSTSGFQIISASCR